MENFEFYSPTRFVFGRESEKKTGELVRCCGGTRALVASLGLNGGSLGAFVPLREPDVACILESCRA